MNDIEQPGVSDLTAGEPKWRRLVSIVGPLAALVVVYVLFVCLTDPSFMTRRTTQTIVLHSTIVATAAIGMTLVIISGGIDLSVGSTIALTTVVIAWLLDNTGLPPLLCAAGGVAGGVAVGLTIGLLVTRLKIVPFIVTLGMMLVIRGMAKGIADEQKIDARATWLTDLVAMDKGWLLPPGVWLMIALAVAAAAMLKFTAFGRHVFAVGSNEQTARLCGVRVSRVRVLVYMLSGATIGLAGVMQFSHLTVGDPTVSVGTELDVIAAVVIGGGSLSGGQGAIFGTIIGALIMSVIETGCAYVPLSDGAIGLANWVQEIVTGCIIVLAVALDRLRQRRLA